MRLAKRLKKRLDKATDAKEIERLRHQLHVAEVDEAYAQHFPHGEPYINLYAKSKSKSEPSEEEETSASEAVLGTERPPIWTTIEKAMKEGPQALTKIRERRSVEEQPATEPRKAQKEEKLTVPPQNRKGTASVPPNKSDKYPPVRPPAVVQKPGQNGKAPALNRRERRRLMREAAAKSGEDKNEGESFFE
jgi:cell division protein FtsN